MLRELLFVPVLAAALLGSEVANAAQVCLTPTRFFSWSAIDERTLIVVDRDKKYYAIKLGGVCSGLQNLKIAIAIVTPTRLSCVGPGDRVRFGDETFGPQVCPIASIASYTPPPEPN